MTLAPYAIAIAAAFAACALSGVQGYRMGSAATEARYAAATAALQQRLFTAAESQSRLAAELEQWRASQSTRAMEAEDAARADPDAGNRRPGAASLRRLEIRWGNNPTP